MAQRLMGDVMKLGKLIIGGFMLSALGWGFLLTYPLLATPVDSSIAAKAGQPIATYIEHLAENLIITGFALALFGALRQCLARLIEMKPSTIVQNHALISPKPALSPTSVVDRGELGGRDYLRFADGTVELETLLGRRKFKTLNDARTFIGG